MMFQHTFDGLSVTAKFTYMAGKTENIFFYHLLILSLL